MYTGLEVFFVTLLVIVTIAIVGFACYAVYKLFQGQR
jgi:flagellar biogenesis protein FliO